MDYVALEVNGEQIDLAEVLRRAKFTSQLKFLHDAIDAALIRQAAAKRNLTFSDEELQEAADNFRVEHHLYDAESTASWFTANHLSQEDWESSLADQIITRKLRDDLTEQKIEQHFAENRLAFDTATLSHLIVAEEGVARELRAQIVEDGADFHALARQFSVDATTARAGGFVGVVRRADMEANVEAAVFGATPGKLIGPLKTDLGWSLIKVEGQHRGKLDDLVRESIKAQLFDEWLKEQHRKARIRIPLLENPTDE